MSDLSSALQRGVLQEQDAELGDGRLPARFWAKVVVTNIGCWEWTSTLIAKGYGRFHLEGKDQLAHRVSYIRLVGPIPDDRPFLDHLCRNRKCVRPSHLEAVTPTENVRRGMAPLLARNSETCRNGLHPWPESAMELATQLVCRECRTATVRRWVARHGRKKQPPRECGFCGAVVSAANFAAHQKTTKCRGVRNAAA